ncbi:hypothetical protein [Flavobacterium oreochromis]|uniref:Polymer-forming cytoskeletal protein n=2 Tax=Flavobacterium TaxID=237 RepID=A0A246GE56_9FLAO|nr:hypothetical protein [Flavobacterium oreochromis]OWP78972.1 hypothetical protein BWG23_00035 [Flavobacterium oreochromis]OWP79668.1 hypothetical protein BWK62_00050 [Flavobacterium oreochromis]POR30747.1 hypothetical protein BWK58_00140 [Flavobacterium columnare]QYS87115.1 hypothetical protein JJC03_03900 [Flavobacterium oreochromis]
MNVKAHSLLYAIYICLLISIICGALLYFNNLYTLLNQHYNLKENLLIQNQSLVNFALGEKLKNEVYEVDEPIIYQHSFHTQVHGLFTVLSAQSIFKNDTVSSTHLVGSYTKNKTALYVSNFSQKLSYTGNVFIDGDCAIPSPNIETAYLINQPSNLKINEKKRLSSFNLPPLQSQFNTLFNNQKTIKTTLNSFDQDNKKYYYNSFVSTTKEVNVPSTITGATYKGNLILTNKDSIRIEANNTLEDVILMAPKITLCKGFKGTLQAFASNKIIIESNVFLTYPSVVCIKNEVPAESSITIKENSKILGSIILFGNQLEDISKNSISVHKNTLIIGDIYCTGKVDFQATLYGSLYANKVFHQTQSAIYDNLIGNATINLYKKPSYYIGVPLFNNTTTSYGIIKKVK